MIRRDDAGIIRLFGAADTEPDMLVFTFQTKLEGQRLGRKYLHFRVGGIHLQRQRQPLPQQGAVHVNIVVVLFDLRRIEGRRMTGQLYFALQDIQREAFFFPQQRAGGGAFRRIDRHVEFHQAAQFAEGQQISGGSAVGR